MVLLVCFPWVSFSMGERKKQSSCLVCGWSTLVLLVQRNARETSKWSLHRSMAIEGQWPGSSVLAPIGELSFCQVSEDKSLRVQVKKRTNRLMLVCCLVSPKLCQRDSVSETCNANGLSSALFPQTNSRRRAGTTLASIRQ